MMSLSPPPPSVRKASGSGASTKQQASVSATSQTHRRKRRAARAESLKPDEYAKAVQGYSLLPTGAGQNHISLGEFLTTKRKPTDFHNAPYVHALKDDFVTLYSLGREEDTGTSATMRTSASPSTLSPSTSIPPLQPRLSDCDVDLDPHPGNTRGQEVTSFHDPHGFFHHKPSQTGPQSSIIFMRGYMTAEWINNIGARYIVDPEFFCRHLDFRPVDDNSNNFSIPALPSSSWHLIELPVITIGTRMTFKGPAPLKIIECLRSEGEEALESHHHRIARLSSSGMEVGESMVRDFYVFDETHFAIEERISICMQTDRSGKTYTLLVWRDSGTDFPSQPPLPWSAQPPESHFLPIIEHKHMIALKCHLFTSPNTGHSDLDARHDQSASHQQRDYGRSLRPNIMTHDAFYSLTEILNFAASSHNEFLNLIDTKLDKYTSLPSDQEFQSLPSLKYTKQILYHHIQKTQRILDSIKEARSPKWPKDSSESGSRKAGVAAQNIERDFIHLLERANTLHRCTNEAITVLMSTVSISESQKAIGQTTRLGKLTFLAFIFVPLSFTTSFFGMNVKQLSNNNLGLQWWVALSVPVTAGAIALFFVDVVTPVQQLLRTLRGWWIGR